MSKNYSYYVTDINEFIIIDEEDYKTRFTYFQRNYAAARISARHEVINDIFYISCHDGGSMIFQIIGKANEKVILEFIGTKNRCGL